MYGEWLEVAAAWQKEDGGIEVKIQVPLVGGRLFLKPNRFKNGNPAAPDYKYAIPADRYYRGEIYLTAVTDEQKRARDLELASDH